MSVLGTEMSTGITMNLRFLQHFDRLLLEQEQHLCLNSTWHILRHFDRRRVAQELDKNFHRLHSFLWQTLTTSLQAISIIITEEPQQCTQQLPNRRRMFQLR